MVPAPTLPRTGHTGLGHLRFFNSDWPLSTKELCLSKSGSNSSTQRGYALATNTWLRKHLLQHNDSADLWSVNFRVGWLQDANTGLFLVYTETEGIGSVVPSGAGRSMILKFSYLFDALD